MTLFTVPAVLVPGALAQSPGLVATQDYRVVNMTDQFDVVIELLPGAEGVGAAEFDITYDDSLIAPVLNQDPNEGLVGVPVCRAPSPALVSCGTVTNGNFRVAVFRLGGQWTEDIDLVTVPFQAQGVSGTSPLTIAVGVLTNSSGVTIPSSAQSGSATVGTPAVPTATTTPTTTPTPAPTATAAPGATSTPGPTPSATPEPTAIPTPKATATSVPTATTVPGFDRPQPTATPDPTATPEPTPSPDPALATPGPTSTTPADPQTPVPTSTTPAVSPDPTPTDSPQDATSERGERSSDEPEDALTPPPSEEDPVRESAAESGPTESAPAESAPTAEPSYRTDSIPPARSLPAEILGLTSLTTAGLGGALFVAARRERRTLAAG